jgi:hypothetical protein
MTISMSDVHLLDPVVEPEIRLTQVEVAAGLSRSQSSCPSQKDLTLVLLCRMLPYA